MERRLTSENRAQGGVVGRTNPLFFKGEPVNSSNYRIVGSLLGVLLFFCAVQAVAQNNRPPLREFELQADSPKFWELVSKDAKLETVATGFGFAEGPVWDKSGFLYVSDEE